MRRRATFISLAVMTAVVSAAQAEIPRTPDGKPSFEGNWTNASLTSLQRGERYSSLVIPREQIRSATESHPQVVRQRTDDQMSKNSQLDGSDLRGGRGYNAFWIDPGMTFAQVKGEYRTSWIVDPTNGQIPYRAEARQQLAASRSNFDGPEARPPAERCILASNSAGPPMNNYLYNNNYEFVQTDNVLLVRAEMINSPRLIKIGGKHIPKNVRTLHGDSTGRWEGNTLVVETTHFHPLHARGQIPLSENAKVIERFSRPSKDQLLYEYTVDDPAFYSQPWRGEMTFTATKDLVYEYACHEGNYALEGTLSGAREEEKRASK